MKLESVNKDLMIKTIAYSRRNKRIYDENILDIIKNTNFSSSEINDAKKEYELTIEYGGCFVPCFAEEYPENLRYISKPPIILTALGNIALLSKTSIAIVGSRAASFNGLALSKAFADDLSSKGFVIVSGIAKGIDAQAHLGAINSTIAVIGSGINVQYPKENEKLYKEIVKNNSLIITEFPFDAKPIPANFPTRNRIIAGIAIGCLVIEAGMQSGSLSTARMALDANRQVFAIPGFALDAKFKGNNYLIKKNVAKLVDCVEDILEDLDGFVPVQASEKTAQSKLFRENKVKSDKVAIQEIQISSDSTPRELILSVLSNQYIGIDEICSKTKLPSNVVSIEIMQLELSGDIISNGINGFCRKY